jgi:glycosyltransferase involved in cell wall biosynthesis
VPRILLTSFGYNDSGGGTIVPRHVSRELARRGWDVTVFHAAVGRVEGPPYAIREWKEDGVRLIGVHNRPHGLLDLGNPGREIDDPPITRAFAEALDRLQPDVIHFHNLHNLGAGLLDEAAGRGIPAYFSTHNYWLVCPRSFLYTERLELCGGPPDRGAGCADCVGSVDHAGHAARLDEIRTRFCRGVSVCLAVSEAMKSTLVGAGYPAEMIDVVAQAMPQEAEIWERLGRDRTPGRVGEKLTVGFFGSAYPHKGPSLLIDAAQRTEQEITVRIHGEVPDAFATHLRSLDSRGVVEIHGGFDHARLPELLAGVDVAVIPSLWWDCAPLMVAECLAGRVPVLAARMGGIPDFVTEDVDGLLFTGRDVSDLTRQLDRLVGEDGLLERLQASIREPRAFAAYVDELERYYADERPSKHEPREHPVTVRWRGDQFRATSLATINRQVGQRLQADPSVALQRITIAGEAHDHALPHPAELEVRHQWPYNFGPAPSRLAVIQPWEFGAIPAEWVTPANANVDEIWVPSAYVREMYVRGGVDPERVVVVPNGVDLDVYTPDGPPLPLPGARGTKLLFVGGLIERKGPDLLLAAYLNAFEGRDDVTLVIKDFGADTFYPGSDRGELETYAREGKLPRIVYLHEEMDEADLAALYRACDLVVLPYRGEGFTMPALEAMASGVPLVITAGGPTDEFVPDTACWRIPSAVKPYEVDQVDHWVTAGRPFMLEPDLPALRDILREAVADEPGRRARGAAGREAAAAHSWDAVAEQYRQRILAIAGRPPRTAAAPTVPFPLDGDFAARLLATPAWLGGSDRLGELLASWTEATSPGQSACLYLLADPRLHGDQAAITSRVLEAAAAAGADLDQGPDIAIVMQHLRGDTEAAIHLAAGGFVPLHGACAGSLRLAETVGTPVVEPTVGGISSWLAGVDRLRSAA